MAGPVVRSGVNADVHSMSRTQGSSPISVNFYYQRRVIESKAQLTHVGKLGDGSRRLHRIVDVARGDRGQRERDRLVGMLSCDSAKRLQIGISFHRMMSNAPLLFCTTKFPLVDGIPITSLSTMSA